MSSTAAERMVWLSQFHRLVWHESCLYLRNLCLDFLEARFVLVLEGRNIFQIMIQSLLAILSFRIDVLLCTKVMSKYHPYGNGTSVNTRIFFKGMKGIRSFKRFLFAVDQMHLRVHSIMTGLLCSTCWMEMRQQSRNSPPWNSLYNQSLIYLGQDNPHSPYEPCYRCETDWIWSSGGKMGLRKWAKAERHNSTGTEAY